MKNKILLILSILASFTFFFRMNIEQNFRNKNRNISKKWNEINLLLSKKKEVLENEKIIDLNQLLNNYLFVYDPDSIELKFLTQEYMLNKILYDQKLIENSAILEIDRKLNSKINEYNHDVKEYNLYYYRFPNYIIARNKFKKKKRFDIKYSSVNRNPIEVKKELPLWLKKK